MSNWVLTSNPLTTYRAEDSLEANSGIVDWISRNNFVINDTVYIYESKSGGRCGIVFKTIVLKTGLTIANKIDDRKFWIGGDYPHYITELTKFNRLKLTGRPNNGLIPYNTLKNNGFVAPQIGAYSLDSKPNLLNYIHTFFT